MSATITATHGLRRRLILVTGLAAVLAGCASAPKPPPPAAVPPPSPAPVESGPVTFSALPGLSPTQRGERAQVLLGAGQLGPARAEIDALLADAPQDPVGRSLMRQITEDPRHLLGGQAVSHTVVQGETLPGLAERYLGDRTLFWALARYNGLPVPNALHPGQVLQIPRPAERRAATRSSHGAGEARGDHPAVPAAKPAQAALRDPVRAGRLRGAALEALSRGEADRAVALLHQALQADPDNAAVKRDLDRAERIRSQLHARH